LRHTLEIEWFLRERCRGGPCRKLIDDAVADLESFMRAYELGGLRMIAEPKDGEAEAVQSQTLRLDALSALHDGFRFFFETKPERFIAVSREDMIRGTRESQFQHYANMRHGSFSEQALKNRAFIELRKKLGRTTVAYNGAPRQLTLDRALRTCFNTGGVTNVLKEMLGASFSKLVENEFVAVWHARLAMAAFADVSDDGALQRLTEALKRTSPFGAVHTGGWQAFYLVE
jgi:hypothetical protein